MATFTLEMDCGNAAFDDDNGRPEIAAILTKLVDKLENGSETGGGLYDTNGNKVGRWDLTA